MQEKKTRTPFKVEELINILTVAAQPNRKWQHATKEQLVTARKLAASAIKEIDKGIEQLGNAERDSHIKALSKLGYKVTDQDGNEISIK